MDLRDKFESIIDDLSSKNWSSFNTIGFSCTYLQLMPSLCLSREVKKNHPAIEIIFGGGNMLPELSEEILKNCSWIDKIFIGEAEKSLPYYLETGRTDIEGIMWKNDFIEFSGISKLETKDIQTLPVPDYDDYYKTTLEEKEIIIQIGRGCIYNQCNFCIFCDHSVYRPGNIERSMNQLKYLVKRHGAKNVSFIDLIMSPNSFKYLPKIPGRYSFCISSFTWSYDHLPYLRDNDCVIGIESFHPKMLKLLNKEQSIIKCISILKWLKHYNVKLSYLLLCGAIHEKGEWYDEALELMKHLTHLPPPRWVQSINHHRDSTYLTNEDYKICPAYEKIFPSSFDLKKIARIFEVNNPEISIQQIKNWSHVERMIDFAHQWKTDYLTRSVSLRKYGNTVLDSRYTDRVEIDLSQSQIEILEKCDYPVSEKTLHRYDSKDIEMLLKTHLLLNQEKQYLSLIEPDTPLEEASWR